MRPSLSSIVYFASQLHCNCAQRRSQLFVHAILWCYHLFVLADQFARNLGLSRSEFYATAVRALIVAQTHDGLTDRINAACAKLDTTLAEDIAQMTRRKLLEVEW